MTAEGRQSLGCADTLRKVIGRARAAHFPPEPADLSTLTVPDAFKMIGQKTFLQYDGVSTDGTRILLFATSEGMKHLADVCTSSLALPLAFMVFNFFLLVSVPYHAL